MQKPRSGVSASVLTARTTLQSVSNAEGNGALGLVRSLRRENLSEFTEVRNETHNLEVNEVFKQPQQSKRANLGEIVGSRKDWMPTSSHGLEKSQVYTKSHTRSDGEINILPFAKRRNRSHFQSHEQSCLKHNKHDAERLKSPPTYKSNLVDLQLQFHTPRQPLSLSRDHRRLSQPRSNRRKLLTPKRAHDFHYASTNSDWPADRCAHSADSLYQENSHSKSAVLKNDRNMTNSSSRLKRRSSILTVKPSYTSSNNAESIQPLLIRVLSSVKLNTFKEGGNVPHSLSHLMSLHKSRATTVHTPTHTPTNTLRHTLLDGDSRNVTQHTSNAGDIVATLAPSESSIIQRRMQHAQQETVSNANPLTRSSRPRPVMTSEHISTSTATIMGTQAALPEIHALTESQALSLDPHLGKNNNIERVPNVNPVMGKLGGWGNVDRLTLLTWRAMEWYLRKHWHRPEKMIEAVSVLGEKGDPNYSDIRQARLYYICINFMKRTEGNGAEKTMRALFENANAKSHCMDLPSVLTVTKMLYRSGDYGRVISIANTLRENESLLEDSKSRKAVARIDTYGILSMIRFNDLEKACSRYLDSWRHTDIPQVMYTTFHPSQAPNPNPNIAYDYQRLGSVQEKSSNLNEEATTRLGLLLVKHMRGKDVAVPRSCYTALLVNNRLLPEESPKQRKMLLTQILNLCIDDNVLLREHEWIDYMRLMNFRPTVHGKRTWSMYQPVKIIQYMIANPHEYHVPYDIFNNTLRVLYETRRFEDAVSLYECVVPQTRYRNFSNKMLVVTASAYVHIGSYDSSLGLLEDVSLRVEERANVNNTDMIMKQSICGSECGSEEVFDYCESENETTNMSTDRVVSRNGSENVGKGLLGMYANENEAYTKADCSETQTNLWPRSIAMELSVVRTAIAFKMNDTTAAEAMYRELCTYSEKSVHIAQAICTQLLSLLVDEDNCTYDDVAKRIFKDTVRQGAYACINPEDSDYRIPLQFAEASLNKPVIVMAIVHRFGCLKLPNSFKSRSRAVLNAMGITHSSKSLSLHHPPPPLQVLKPLRGNTNTRTYALPPLASNRDSDNSNLKVGGNQFSDVNESAHTFIETCAQSEPYQSGVSINDVRQNRSRDLENGVCNDTESSDFSFNNISPHNVNNIRKADGSDTRDSGKAHTNTNISVSEYIYPDLNCGSKSIFRDSTIDTHKNMSEDDEDQQYLTIETAKVQHDYILRAVQTLVGDDAVLISSHGHTSSVRVPLEALQSHITSSGTIKSSMLFGD
eukprot:CFRG8516T1